MLILNFVEVIASNADGNITSLLLFLKKGKSNENKVIILNDGVPSQAPGYKF